ncbi:MAG: hypothetical protein DBX55_00480 [Verrucomicrobia bacterium]|nr:MAG: hypothetical protein DBX55_00480 [Verrucomicrobiota bacterium]
MTERKNNAFCKSDIARLAAKPVPPCRAGANRDYNLHLPPCRSARDAQTCKKIDMPKQIGKMNLAAKPNF